MPFLFGIIGIVLIVSGVRGTVTGSNPNLVGLLQQDLTGTPNYIEWMLAIGLIGAIGYVDSLKGLSRAFMTLVVIGMIISDKGVFDPTTGFVAQIKSISQNPANSATTNNANNSPLAAAEQGLSDMLKNLPTDNQIFSTLGL